MAMAPMLILFLLVVAFSFNSSESRLTLDYYKNSCPQFNQIIRDTITNKHISTLPPLVPQSASSSTICLPNTCDASVLISFNAYNKAELHHYINFSLPGDSFDVVVRAKTTFELACPNTVSCADIFAVATRDLITMVSGPYYNVYLGRRDDCISKAAMIEGKLPRPTMSILQIIEIFSSKRFSVKEIVALQRACANYLKK